MGITLKRGMDSHVGRILAKMFRDKYGENPPKHSQYVDGALRSVNTYFARDRDLVEDAILQATQRS